jgi:hypothetical protein
MVIRASTHQSYADVDAIKDRASVTARFFQVCHHEIRFPDDGAAMSKILEKRVAALQTAVVELVKIVSDLLDTNGPMPSSTIAAYKSQLQNIRKILTS